MVENSRSSKVHAGVGDKGVEFFFNKNDIWCFHDGKIYQGFNEIPDHIIDMIKEDMIKYPEAMQSLTQWENLLEADYARRYVMCRMGGNDKEPDIDAEGNIHHSEFFDCKLRGTCKYEGKLCLSIKVGDQYLTKTELRILKHVTLLDKEIADKLCISEE